MDTKQSPINLGRVVRKVVNINLGLNVNWSITFSCLNVLMFGVVWDNYSSKLKGKQCKKNTTPKSYKTEIKIIANPRLAQSGFEQPGPGALFWGVNCLVGFSTNFNPVIPFYLLLQISLLFMLSTAWLTTTNTELSWHLHQISVTDTVNY